MAEELTQRILYAAARRFCAALNAACINWLARDTGRRVDIRRVHAAVLVRNPRHLALARAHVGRRDVLGWVDQIALRQLIGKAAGDKLKLVLVILARIDAKPAFGATERRLHKGALIRHQSRKRFYLVLVHTQRVANTSLHRLHMFAVNRTVSCKCLDLPAQTHTKAHCIGRVAHPDFLFQTRRQIHHRHCAVKHQVHAFAKTRLFKISVHTVSLSASAIVRNAAPQRLSPPVHICRTYRTEGQPVFRSF